MSPPLPSPTPSRSNSTELAHATFVKDTPEVYSPNDTSAVSTLVGSPPQSKPGSYIETSVPDLSTARLLLVHFGAALTLFLATTDATIVSTSAPTIVRELRASQSIYTWIGVSYMLTQTAFQPVYGKLSDILGRKVVMFTSIFIFALGSLLCGAAKTSSWLVGARALAGVGGGGIVSSVWTLTAEIVPVKSRPKWSQALSVTWACSAVAGPLLGGAFSSNSMGWRWAFYINLPICAAASAILALTLRSVTVGKVQKTSWQNVVRRFDFLGLFFFMVGSSTIVLGFTLATEYGWKSSVTLSLIPVGTVALVGGGVYEIHTKRDALFSPTTFKDLSAVGILAIIFLHNFAFNAGTYYLALFWQVMDGQSPVGAGIQLLPYSLGSSLASMPVAWFIARWQQRTGNTRGQNWVVFTGLVISTLGFGLMHLLDNISSRAVQAIIALIAGVGLGALFHAPFQIFTRILRPEELASGTSAFFLTRFTGATIGLSVAGAVFNARLSQLLPSEVAADVSSPGIDWSYLMSIDPPELRSQVHHAVGAAFQAIWTVCTPCLGVAALIALSLRVFPTENQPSKSMGDEEKGDVAVTQTKTTASNEL